MREVDDYEKRLKDNYWSSSSDSMYDSLEKKWRDESFDGLGFKNEAIYSSRSFLLELSQRRYEWRHYVDVPKFSSARLQSLSGPYLGYLAPTLAWINTLRSRSTNYLLYGGNSIGKTHTAYAACRFMSLHGIIKDGGIYLPNVRVLNCVDAHNILDGWKKSEDVTATVADYVSAGILIVDDMGAVSTSAQSAISNVLSIIATRYDNDLPTVVTANLPPSELIEMYGSTTIRRLITEKTIVCNGEKVIKNDGS